MPQQKLNLFQFPALSIGIALPPSAAYAACGMSGTMRNLNLYIRS
jgi:hypothetical protein